MVNLHALPRSQQLLLGLGAIAVGTLAVLAITLGVNQRYASLTGANLALLEDDGLTGDVTVPDDTTTPSEPVTEPADVSVSPTGDGTSGSGDGGPGTEAQRGVSHITYLSGGFSPALVRYANNSGGSWSVETAASDAHAGVQGAAGLSMAIGVDGSIHAVYFPSPQDYRYVRYATKSPGGTWTVTNIPTGTTSGPLFGLSLQVDQAGRAHVAYANGTNGPPDRGVYYATNRSGAWVVERVRTVSQFYFYTGARTALALDASGAPQVSFVSLEDPPFGERGLLHARKVGNTWQMTVIDPETNLRFLDNNLELDSRGFVHIAYQNFRSGTLNYATNRSGAWNRETLPTPQWYGDFATLALDPSGKAHLAFLGDFAPEGSQVLYGTNVSGSWTIQPAVVQRGNYHNLSIDVDQQGKSYISFIGFVAGDPNWLVRHATNVSGTWTVAPVNSEFGWTGPGTSLRVRSRTPVPGDSLSPTSLPAVVQPRP